ncbi:heparin lyase I family protein [Catalinimonas niigatensis]|uniref:heparin lyase I family protein n=1 Tax=Catalinimonas niigatensis TaxID=1397264 RepID=UPI002665EFF3|nr:heparin lyase I family protein [Catalinimonas niigatensis]WPP48656.1 heparin lyase I family protein [Catalinimonas niigatensis]
MQNLPKPLYLLRYTLLSILFLASTHEDSSGHAVESVGLYVLSESRSDSSDALPAALHAAQPVQRTGINLNTDQPMTNVNHTEGAVYDLLQAGRERENTNSHDLPSALPRLQLLRAYEFEDNIGRNVNIEQDGIKVHHLSREGGIVESVDGGERGKVGAYHFKIVNDPQAYNGSGKFYRQELQPRDLPSPYFKNGWQAKFGQEYVYQLRMKMTENYQIGKEYVSFMGGKNDYSLSRNGTALKTSGDHYRFEMQFDTKSGGTGNGQEDGPYASWRRKHFACDGKELIPKKDFNHANFMGAGYHKLSDDIGKWIVWTWHVKWSYGSDGFVRIYKDDQLFVSYDGPNTFKDEEDRAPYFKFGIYNNYWKNLKNNTGSKVQETYVDYFRVYVPE